MAVRGLSGYAVGGGGWVELIRVNIVGKVEGQSRLVGGVDGYRDNSRWIAR
jgi:hypothetical protein